MSLTVTYLDGDWPFAVQDVRVGASPSRPSPIPREDHQP